MKTRLFFFSSLLAVFLFAFAWMFVTTRTFAAGIYQGGTTGNDISYPQCSTSSYPSTAAFGIVGVTGGRAFTHNSCFSSEYAWAAALMYPSSVYMNLNTNIGTTASNGMTGPYGTCQKNDKLCQAENYGYNAAADAYTYAVSATATHMWWLDIETGNSWSANTRLNQGTINGATQFFADQRIPVGIYSSPSMWTSITGSYHNGLAAWMVTTTTTPQSYCSSTPSFTGGTLYLVQYSNASVSVDSDYAC